MKKEVSPSEALNPAMERVFAALAAEAPADPVPAALWERISDDIAAGATLEPLDLGEASEPLEAHGSPLVIALSCAFCRGSLRRDEACYCASCLTPHHADCFATHGRCSTMGCEETHTVRPQLTMSPGDHDSGHAGGSSRGKRGVVVALSVSALLGVGLSVGMAGYKASQQRALERAQAVAEQSARVDSPVPVAPRETRAEAPPIEREVGPEAADRPDEVDLNAEAAPLREVMDELARKAGVNILVDPSVHERVSVDLKRIPWREALALIAKMAGCRVEEPSARVFVLTQPPKVTIQFEDADVHTVLQLLAAYSGQNVLIAADVEGSWSGDLVNVDWAVALEGICEACGLHARRKGGIVVVAAHAMDWGERVAGPSQPSDRKPELEPRGELVTLKGRATVAAHAGLISRAAGRTAALRCDTTRRIELTLTDVPWPDALALLARQASLDVVVEPERIVFTDMSENQLTIRELDGPLLAEGLRAVGAVIPDSGWLESRLVSAELREVSFDAALPTLEAIATSPPTESWIPDRSGLRAILKMRGPTGLVSRAIIDGVVAARGDLLPDGAKVLEIREDTVLILDKGGLELPLRLFD